MFKKIKSLFTKSEEKNVLSGLITYMEEDGNMYVDIRMSDYSEDSLESLVSLISMYNPSSMLEILSIIKIQLEKEGKIELYNQLLELLTGVISLVESEISTEEEPCINPSDVI
tara:strand:+ start:81 stop:419 length:339 start_codon:yes stop_codon:yes gene_type:complete